MGKTEIIIQEESIKFAALPSIGGDIAVVMEAARGRTNKVTSLTNVNDFRRIFGDGNTPAHVACNYLLSRGTTVKIVRCEPKSGSGSKAAIKFPYSETSGSNGLTFQAKENGSGMNGFAIKLTLVQPYDDDPATTELFKAELYKGYEAGAYIGDPIEIFPVVTLQEGALNFVNTINGVSQYIEVTADTITTTPVMFDAEAVQNDVYAFDGFVPKMSGGAYGNPAKASLVLPYDEAQSGNGMQITAVANGVGYNGIGIKVANQSSDGTVFSLEVYGTFDGANYGNLLEEFPAVSLDKNSQYFYGDTVASDIIEIGAIGTGNLFASGNRGEVGHVYDNGLGLALSGGNGDYWNGADGVIEKLGEAATYFADKKISFATAIVPGYYGGTAWSIFSGVVNQKKDFIVIVDPVGTSVNAVVTENIARSTYGDYYFPMCKVPGYGILQTSVVMAAKIAAMHQAGLQYKAPAGIENGVLTDVIDTGVKTEVGESLIELSSDDIARLQEKNINPIAIRSDVGCVAWGQSCSIMGNAEVTRLAVRILTNYFRRAVREISEQFIFADNNEITWNAWKLAVEPIIRDVYAVNGIRAYNIVCDETTMTEQDIANGKLIGIIYFWPLSQIEKVQVKFTVDETGVSFE